MGNYRLRVKITGPNGQCYEDAVYVGACTEHGARAAALARWPWITEVLSIQEVWN